MTGPPLDFLNIDPKKIIQGMKAFQQNSEMLQNGITNEQKKAAYYPRVSEALYHNIDPYVYSGQENSIKQAIHDTFFKLHIPDENRLVETPRINEKEPLGIEQTSRLDAFRLYLGLPQKYGTFLVSEHAPANSEDNDVTYFKIPKHEEILRDPYYFKRLILQVENAKKGTYDDHKAVYSAGVSRNKGLISGFDPTTVLGSYKLDLGKDEKGNYISYYDKWDLDPQISGKIGALIGLGTKMIGHPYEIYNRIYYDPKTRKPIK